jgi:transcriptional regulator with XRE-family HTH domain
MTPNPNINTRLKFQRTNMGYSLETLGKMTGISKQDLDRIEDGKNPTEQQLKAILKVWPELNKEY